MKFIWMFLGFLCLSAIVLAAPVDQDDVTVSDEEWENFKKEYGKNYATKEEEAKRRANYAKNMKENVEDFKIFPELNNPMIKQLLDLNDNEMKDLLLRVMVQANVQATAMLQQSKQALKQAEKQI